LEIREDGFAGGVVDVEARILNEEERAGWVGRVACIPVGLEGVVPGVVGLCWVGFSRERADVFVGAGGGFGEDVELFRTARGMC
jgi:hypothetical protein